MKKHIFASCACAAMICSLIPTQQAIASEELNTGSTQQKESVATNPENKENKDDTLNTWHEAKYRGFFDPTPTGLKWKFDESTNTLEISKINGTDFASNSIEKIISSNNNNPDGVNLDTSKVKVINIVQSGDQTENAGKIQLGNGASKLFSNFANLETINNLDLFDTSNVEDMSGMFSSNPKLKNINGTKDWDTSRVTDMSSLFEDSGISSINPISNWDVSNVENMQLMFRNTKNLRTVHGLDEKWNTSNVTDMTSMFEGGAIESADGIRNFKTRNVHHMSNMFYQAKNLSNVKGITWDNTYCDEATGMFAESGLTTTEGLEVFTNDHLASMGRMFMNANKLEDIKALENWDISNTNDIGRMFTGTTSLKEANLGKWKTSYVGNIVGLFENSGVKKITGLENWDTKNVWNMGKAFSNTTNLTQIPGIEKWNTSSATDMNDMFANSSVTSLDISKWDLTQALNGQTGSSNNGVRNMFGGSKIDDITIPSGVDLTQTNLSALTDIWKEASAQDGNLRIKKDGFSNSAEELIKNNANPSESNAPRRFLRGYFMAAIKHGEASISCLVNTNGKNNFVDAIVNCQDKDSKIVDFRNLDKENANKKLATLLGLQDEIVTAWNNGESAFNSDLTGLDLNKDFNLTVKTTVKTQSTQTESSNVVEPSADESLDSNSDSESNLDSDSGYSLLRLYRLLAAFNQNDYSYSSYYQASAAAKTYAAKAYAAEPSKVAEAKTVEAKTEESAQSQQENQDTSYKAEIANKTAENKKQTEPSSNSSSNKADSKDLQSNDSKENYSKEDNSKDEDSSKSVNKKKSALKNNSSSAKPASSNKNTNVLMIGALAVFVVAIAGIATFVLKKN
ncbi:BspA family leucine-rich repeat surface protein [Gardnerella vaginalis]|uniref:Bacterial surface protein 26-residue PARCEL repeat-containing domain protein n=1 Tax=Gardnerella vaginalis TaxID=2702 RepID=A0A133NQ85_GARVA|nr:BspA family leucine-rich repeat surface protein [Gardnerella vaginalis]KXA18452.1 bacterial surface protein 26-residue PARCEL repeat-containing domain protein [Gardnerella vaginalis]